MQKGLEKSGMSIHLDYDLIVIGSGPGGYVSAIHAAKHGLKTAIIEARELGGTCLNRGCIPTKSLLKSSHLFSEIRSGGFGIHVSDVSANMEEIIDRKDEVVASVREGIRGLLEGNGVDIYYERATILGSGKVSLSNGEIKTSKYILIATGAKAVKPPIAGSDSTKVFTSDELLQEKVLHEHLIIVGGGVIGCEFATIYQELGKQVTIIEYMDRILPNMDREVSTTLAQSLKKKGVAVLSKAKVMDIKEEGEQVAVTYAVGEKTETIRGDRVLIATGRKAFTENLLDGIDLNKQGGAIEVNQNFETSVAGIYAVGDVVVGPQLAHVASAQGMIAVEHMNCSSANCSNAIGKEPSIDLNVIPSCIYTSPEIATTGLTKEDAKIKGIPVIISKYPLSGNCKSVISADERGYIKLIVEENTKQVLGGEIICSRATDMIDEVSLAIVHKLTAEDLMKVIRPHPTYIEGITEAASDIYKKAIHMLRR